MLTAPRSTRARQLVLYVVNDAKWFITHRLPVARGAEAAGYEVHVATPPGSAVNAVRREGFPWHEVNFARGSINPLREMRTFLSFLRLYRALRPDLVHHVSAKPVLYGTLAARLARVPAVVNAVTGLGHLFLANDIRHAVIRTAVGLGYRFVLRHARLRVIFQNDDDRSLFVGRGMSRAADSVIIRSGVDTQTFRPTERIAGSVPVVILPSRLIFTKGVAEFVEAATILRASGVQARFVLVGGADAQNPACIPTAQIEEWKSAGIVELWGEQQDMPEVYAKADIVCLPSYREGMPKVLIEAAACGLPAVTTDAPGCRHVVDEGKTGFLVPVRNSEKLADRLRALLVDEELRARFGRAARARAESEFSSTAYAAATVGLYREVLG